MVVIPLRLFYIEQPLYSALPMNFLLVKLSHHLLGFPSPPSSKTLASKRAASS